MRWMERLGIWLLTHGRFLRRDQTADASGMRLIEGKRRFTAAYREVCDACGLLEKDSAMTAAQLAAAYMSAVLDEENDPDWWEKNDSLTQPWFIRSYGEGRGWFRDSDGPQSPDFYMVRPDGAAFRGCVRMELKRKPDRPEEGTIILPVPGDQETDALLRGLKCALTENGDYVRRIREVNGRIEDRAAEIGAALLEAGYAVQVSERALRDSMAAGNYEAEHLYWVYEAKEQDQLCLRYPKNSELHRYVCLAGGKWDGKRVTMPVSSAEALEELDRQYGFRFTKEARRRLDLWHMAMEQAGIYQGRKRKNQPRETPRDRFATLLARPVQVPEDLRDEQ